VLILTWTDYVPASKRALAMAKGLSERFAKDGLVVVGAHGKDEWAAAAKPGAGEGATWLLAHDAKGEFRSYLESDADPDFYIIDRAGQLRFADIANESVASAVEMVVKESAEEAGGVNAKLAAEAAAREAELRRTRAQRGAVDLTKLPEVDFEMPSDEAFSAKWMWPPVPKDQNNALGGDPSLPVKMPLPDTGFFPARPNLKGRVVLLYFWSMDMHESYKDMVRFDLLQKQAGRNLAVVGVMSPLTQQSQDGSAPVETPEALERRVRSFLLARKLEHALMADLGGTLMQAVGLTNSATDRRWPQVAVVSSDGTLRSWGWFDDPAVQAAFDTVLRNDPGAAARRKAEEAYLKARPK
jgi:hypothetical protein